MVVNEFLFFIVLLTASGLSNGEPDPEPKDPQLYVSITEIGNEEGDNITYVTNPYTQYNFVYGKTLKFICKWNITAFSGGSSKSVFWTDDNGFRTAPRAEPGIQINPDDEDNNHNFTCVSTDMQGGIANISVNLFDNTATRTKPSSGNVVHLNIGKPWTSNQCYGIAYYPTETIILDSYEKHTVIPSFNASLNGTVFYCIQYTETGSKDVTVDKRVKKKYTFYLNNADHTNGPPSNIFEIVGGVLGSIVIVLLGVLLGIWYKTRRQKEPNDADDGTRVIYAEIEERSTAPPPPPPRNPISYSHIIGTLMPRLDNQSTT